MEEDRNQKSADKIKGFVQRHGKKVAIGVFITAATVGAVILFNKNPEVGKRLKLILTGLFNNDEKSQVIEIADVAGVEDNLLEEAVESEAKRLHVQEEDPEVMLSARKLGDLIGLTSQQVNKKLAEIGLLEGKPGDWAATEEGKKFSVPDSYDNGIGGYYHICNPYYRWKKSVVYMIGDPDTYREEVNRVRAELGIELMSEAA